MSSVLLRSIISACRRLHGQGLLAAGDGNVSVRLPYGSIAITPRGISKANLHPQDFAFMEPEGRILSGDPSSERAMHLAVYAAVPEARAVVHAHPITAIAWSLARPELTELPADTLPEVIISAGRIPIVPMATPGTAEMGARLRPYLPQHRLMILARHGGLAWGESLDEAVGAMERLEQVAKILLAAEQLGGAKTLSDKDLVELRQLRQLLGPRIL